VPKKPTVDEARLILGLYNLRREPELPRGAAMVADHLLAEGCR
jgi:hypothetical protein